eukprot:3023589-Pleurochrysis_carterae.AAC.3
MLSSLTHTLPTYSSPFFLVVLLALALDLALAVVLAHSFGSVCPALASSVLPHPALRLRPESRPRSQESSNFGNSEKATSLSMSSRTQLSGESACIRFSKHTTLKQDVSSRNCFV